MVTFSLVTVKVGVWFVLLLGRNQAQVTVFAKHPPIQRMAPMVIWLRGELDDADLTAVAVLVEGVPLALYSVAISTVFFGDDELLASTTLGGVFPVVIVDAIDFSNLSLSKPLLSNLLVTRCTSEARRVVGALQCTDNKIFYCVTTRPAKLQTGLVAVFTQWDSSFVVVQFARQWDLTLSTLEATVMVGPIQCLDGGLSEGHCLPAEATQLVTLRTVVQLTGLGPIQLLA